MSSWFGLDHSSTLQQKRATLDYLAFIRSDRKTFEIFSGPTTFTEYHAGSGTNAGFQLRVLPDTLQVSRSDRSIGVGIHSMVFTAIAQSRAAEEVFSESAPAEPAPILYTGISLNLDYMF